MCKREKKTRLKTYSISMVPKFLAKVFFFYFFLENLYLGINGTCDVYDGVYSIMFS